MEIKKKARQLLSSARTAIIRDAATVDRAVVSTTKQTKQRVSAAAALFDRACEQ